MSAARGVRVLKWSAAIWVVLITAASRGPETLEARQAAETLVFYLDSGPFPSDAMVRSGQRYFPVLDLARRLALQFAEDEETSALTIRGPRGTIQSVENSRVVRLDDEDLDLEAPVVREGGRWWVPVGFLTPALGQITGIDFRHTPGRPRVIAVSGSPPLLDMAAAESEAGTRLTIRAGARINLRVQRDRAQNHVILVIDRAPVAPTRERLDYQDARLRSVLFDDSDGISKIVIETTVEPANVRLVPADENRTFYIDFVSESAPPEVLTALAPPLADGLGRSGRAQVIVIDPGHGGLDSGTSAHGTLEKDVTLLLARELRAALQSRLNATVILTRDGDREASAEERVSIANNSNADLLISVHVGYSMDPTESSASLFVMSPPSTMDPSAQPNAFFRPWYTAHVETGLESRRFAEMLHEELDPAVPLWEFPVREAPIGVLASAVMPAVVIELGNANNSEDQARLMNGGFRTRVIDAVRDAIDLYGRTVFR